MTKNKVDPAKITAIEAPQRKIMLKNILDISENTPVFSLLADERKQKKIYHIIKAILAESDKEDEDYKDIESRFTQLLLDRKQGTTSNKRKPANQGGFMTAAQFNSCLKIQKTFHTISDKEIPSNWIKITSTLREPIVFIDAKDEEEAKKIKEKIEFNKNELKISAEITNVRASGDRVITKLTNSTQETIFIQEIKELLGEINIYPPSLRDPMIMLYKIPAMVNTDEFIADLRKFNNFNSDDKIIFHKSFNILFNAYKNIILRVSPAIREELERKRGSLLYKCSTIKAADYFGILRCTRCLRYGHLKTVCGSQSICKYCADFHLSDDCQHKLNSIKFKCASCNQAGHTADDKKNCPEYLKQLNHVVSITNYAYSYVIQD
uniref:CCHC-type domain-containing protein n=2 Tax=Tetranychus urticae TaxID=32264 RepID=T1KG85_TETUR